jgi:hypothetical protein
MAPQVRDGGTAHHGDEPARGDRYQDRGDVDRGRDDQPDGGEDLEGTDELDGAVGEALDPSLAFLLQLGGAS